MWIYSILEKNNLPKEMRIELNLCVGDAEMLLQIISFYFFGNTYLKNVCLFFSPTFHPLFSQHNLLYNSTSIRNFPINSQTALIYFWCISVFSGEHAISALWPTYLLQFGVSRDNSLCVRIYSIPRRALTTAVDYLNLFDGAQRAVASRPPACNPRRLSSLDLWPTICASFGGAQHRLYSLRRSACDVGALLWFGLRPLFFHSLWICQEGRVSPNSLRVLYVCLHRRVEQISYVYVETFTHSQICGYKKRRGWLYLKDTETTTTTTTSQQVC